MYAALFRLVYTVLPSARASYGAISLEQAIMYATWKIPVFCQLTACASSFRYKLRFSLKLPQTHPEIWYEMLVSDESIPLS